VTHRGNLEVRKLEDKDYKSIPLETGGVSQVIEWPPGDHRAIAVLSPTHILSIHTLKTGTWETVHRHEAVAHFCWGPTARNATIVTTDHRLELIEWGTSGH
jgi:hypothetical protein